MADEFPGALRELDLLGLPEIEKRIRRLEQLESLDRQEGPQQDRMHEDTKDGAQGRTRLGSRERTQDGTQDRTQVGTQGHTRDGARHRVRDRAPDRVQAGTAGHKQEGTHHRTDDGEPEHWIPWILAYHAIMRAALGTKRALSGVREPSATSLPALVRNATAVAGVRLDKSFVRAVARPPSGRIAIVVLHTVAQIFNVSMAPISATLFPPRRAPPYSLDLW